MKLIYSQTPETPTVLKLLPQNIGSQWESGKVLADCLSLLVDVDDLQSAVCILIVLGDRRNDLPLDEGIHVRSSLNWHLNFTASNQEIFSLSGILAIIIH